MQESLSRQDSIINDIHQQIGRLEDQLQTVRSVTPSPAGKVGEVAPQPPRSNHVCSRLNEHSNDLEGALKRIVSLRESLDV